MKQTRFNLKLIAILTTIASIVAFGGCVYETPPKDTSKEPDKTNTELVVTEEEKAFLDKYYSQEYIDYLENADMLEKYKQFDLLYNTLSYAENNFYRDLDFDALDKELAIAAVQSLDRYSNMSATSLSLNGTISQAGVGITISSNVYNVHTVDIVHPGSGAEGVLQRGDILQSITNTSIDLIDYRLDGLSSSYIPAAIAGDENTELLFTVIRGGETLSGLRVLKKNYIVQQSCYVNNLGGDIPDAFGYIKLYSFAHGADEHFKRDVESFVADGNEALILDLRNNGGGTTTVMANVASYLLSDGTNRGNLRIIELENKESNTTMSYNSAQTNNYLNVPIYVLTNANTASASEAMLSAMLYYNTGTQIGTTTYGKGVGQTIREKALKDDDGVYYSVSMTSGIYYIMVPSSTEHPDGRMCIDGIGLLPDEDNTFSAEDTNSFYEDRSDDPLIKRAAELYAAQTDGM